MKIGILETGEVADALKARHGAYPSMFERLFGEADPGLKFATVSVVRGEMPAAPEQADAWVVTGSKHGVYDPLPWIEPLKAFLRDCLDRGVPVVGICFGHQLLAEALGGRVEKSAQGWGIGVQDYETMLRPGWMADAPERFAAPVLHQDQVVEKPASATVLARSPFCPYAALAYGDPERPSAISLQPHPEFRPEFLDDLIAARTGVLPAAAAAAARASLARPTQNRAWARWIIAYLRQACAGRAAA